MPNSKTVKQLKALLADVPDDTPIFITDSMTGVIACNKLWTGLAKVRAGLYYASVEGYPYTDWDDRSRKDAHDLVVILS